jgi:hypothetical protein
MWNWYHHLRRFVTRAAASLPPRLGRRRATFRPKVEGLEGRRVLSHRPQVVFILPPVQTCDPVTELTVDASDASRGDFQDFLRLFDGATPADPGTATLAGAHGKPIVNLFPDSTNPTNIRIQLPQPIKLKPGHYTFKLKHLTAPGALTPLVELPRVELFLHVTKCEVASGFGGGFGAGGGV